jgi:hypothetical protein
MTCVQHVVMVAPIDVEVDETQHIAQQHRDQGRKGLDALTRRHLQLQHHDGDDGDYAIAECLKPTLAHSCLVDTQRNFHVTKTATTDASKQINRKIGNSSLNE